MSATRRPTISLALLCAALLPSCSTGGEEERPSSTVKIESALRIFGFTGRPEFGPFPVTVNDVLTFDERLLMQTDGVYRRTDSQGAALSSDVYLLEPNGEFSILVPVGDNPVRYRGWLGLEERQGALKVRDGFLTDRVGSAVGLYLATEILLGDAPANADEFATRYGGDWHLFSMHANFAAPNSVPDVDRVGLAFAGRMTVARDGSFLGTGIESEDGSIQVRGEAADFAAQADGRILLEVRYDASNKPDYERSFLAGGGGRLIFGVDPNIGGEDQAAGLVAVMKFRTATFAAADLEGTYALGLGTLFLRTDASGTDAAIGTLQLTRQGSFTLRAVNNTGADFSYGGTYRAEANGSLTFTVTAPTTETWYGSFDDEYETVVFCDPSKETRANRQVELNFGVAVRQRTPL
jgi:hypothetical protein